MSDTAMDIQAPSLPQTILSGVRNRKLFAFTAVLVVVLVIAAIAAPWLTPYDPRKIDFAHKLVAPNAEHFFGTDALGHDVFSQVMAGAWLSLAIAAAVVLLSVAIGLPLGAVSGYYGGKVDAVVMRFCDVFLAFPPLLLPIALSAALGPSVPNMVIAIAASWFPWYARLVRASTISVRSQLYISAARTMGLRNSTILVRHCLPNCLNPVIAQASMDFGAAIITAASLSFIGVGVRPPDIEWGLLVSLSRSTFLDCWWTAAFPGFAIVVTVLITTTFGDGLRDLLDPRHSGNG